MKENINLNNYHLDIEVPDSFKEIVKDKLVKFDNICANKANILQEIDTLMSENNEDYCHNYLFYNAMYYYIKSGKNDYAHVLDKFKNKLTDNHKGLTWDLVIECIPDYNNYKYLSIINSLKDNYDYKLFRNSICNKLIEQKNPNTIALFCLSDKNFITYKEIPKILIYQCGELTSILSKIKMPPKHNVITDSIFKETLNYYKHNSYSMSPVIIKSKKELKDFFINNYDKYQHKELNETLYNMINDSSLNEWEGLDSIIRKVYYSDSIVERKIITIKNLKSKFLLN